MEFQEKSDSEGDNIQELLDDIALPQDGNNFCFAKRDNTFFVVDCSSDIMTPLSGQKQSQYDKIMESYSNFMKSKVIASCSDRVGLIFYNVNKKQNSLNFDHICTVHPLQIPSAKMIKSVDKIAKDFMLTYGHSDQKVSLHQVLWLFGQQIKDCDPSKNHARLFLFTAEDSPHSQSDQRRQQTINHARQLAAKGAQIQLFPVRRSLNAKFDVRKFYQQILTFDQEDINQNLLDNSSKILDLQTRIRQKQFKKRTLNRLLMQVGTQTHIGVKLYAMYSKARKPNCKKLQASTNKPLKRVVKRLNPNGQILFNEQIGTYYKLGDTRVKLSKEDMIKIKGLKPPGLTLIGFKPKKFIKPYHNLRASYFLYPDQEHVSGSSQFVDALIDQLYQTQQIAIVSLMPRVNQQLRFAALFPQKQSYDQEDHHQTPPGFNMIILPYSDDIVNFTGGQKTIVKPAKVSMQLLKLTKLLINNLTVSEFDFRSFQNPSLQKFYSHLQAHALNQPHQQSKKDTMLPDYQGFDKYSDIYKMIQETADAQIQAQLPEEVRKPKRSSSKKEQKKEQKLEDDATDRKKSKRSSNGKSKDKKDRQQLENMDIEKRSKVNSKKESIKKQTKREQSELISKVHSLFEDGKAFAILIQQMSTYLKINGLDSSGNKSELADRIMLYISHSFD